MDAQLKKWLVASLSPERLFNACCLYMLDLFAYLKYSVILKYYINFIVSIMDFTGYRTVPVTDKINWRASYIDHRTFNCYLQAYYLTQHISYVDFQDFCIQFSLPFKNHCIIIDVDGVETAINVTIDEDRDMLKFQLNNAFIFSDKQNLNPYNIFNELCQRQTKITSD